MDEFAARGYRGTSLDMVAGKLGVTRQALLHYFPSKVKLLLAVLELREQQDADRFLRLARQHGWSFAELFPAVVREYTERPELPRSHTVLAAEAIDPEPQAAALLALLEGLQLQALLEPGRSTSSTPSQPWQGCRDPATADGARTGAAPRGRSRIGGCERVGHGLRADAGAERLGRADPRRSRPRGRP